MVVLKAEMAIESFAMNALQSTQIQGVTNVIPIHVPMYQCLHF
jgi:hypothetical protein